MAEEGMELVGDGTVKWSWKAGKAATYRSVMRRPTFGEFRKLREEYNALLDDTSDSQIKTADSSKALLDAVNERKLDDLPQLRSDVRSQTARIEEGNMEWLRSAFDMLADKELPAEDDLPAWFAGGGTIINELIAHWRSRPLAPGGA